MIIPSEKYLFDRVIKFYNDNMKNLAGEDAEEFIKVIKKIISCINYGDDCIRELLNLKLYEDKKDQKEHVRRVYFTPSSDEKLNECLIILHNNDKSNFHLSVEMKNDLKDKASLSEKIRPIMTDLKTNDKTFLNCLTTLLECQVDQPFRDAQDNIDCCRRLLDIYDKVVKTNNQLNYSEDNVLECCLLFVKNYSNMLRDKLGTSKLITSLQFYSVLKEQDVVSTCEVLKNICTPYDFQSLHALLNMDIPEDQQFWEYICQCVQMPSQQIPIQQMPSQQIPTQQFFGCQYIPSNFIPPSGPINNGLPSVGINLPPSPPN